MKKICTPHVITLVAFAIFVVLGLACASAPDGSKALDYAAQQRQQQQTQSQQAQQPATTSHASATPATTQTSPSAPASQFWTGDGGRGMRLGIIPPQGQGLNANQEYLPALIQGVLAADISKYSAISVLDRISLDRVIMETLNLTYEDDLDIVQLGKVPQVQYWMTGSVIRTSTGYTLQLNVTDTSPNPQTLAAFSGTATIAELDDHSAIHRATLELLQQMNVRLTARARNELGRASTLETINSQASLARGVTAIWQGTEVAALSYFLQAATFDPLLQEAENRLEILTAAFTSGNAGMDARNEIAWRRQWMERLQETENFYRIYTRDNPPFYLLYDTDIRQGVINFHNETVELSFGIKLVPDAMWAHTINELILTVEKGLWATGRSESWGLDWPNNVVSITSPFQTRSSNFSVVAEIINDQGRSLGKQTISVPYGYSVRYGMTIPRQNWQGTVSFPQVDTNLISESISIRIISIDGILAGDAALQRRINILPLGEFGHRFRPGGVAATDEALFSVRDDGTLTTYNGTQTNVVIPSIINGVWVVEIGERAFRDKRLISVTIPVGVRVIANEAFSRNPMPKVTIPGSIRSIGSGAFSTGGIGVLTDITIQNGVRTIAERAFSAMSENINSVTIGTDVNLIGELFSYTPFRQFYEQNGKKAGTYRRTGTGNNRTWAFSPQ